MALLDIVLYPDPCLREMCEPVEQVTDEIRKLLDDMADTMYDAPGIGLAGPQVGVNYRVLVVDVGEDPPAGHESSLFKLINPEIVEETGKTDSEEGCLSIPDIRETIKRAETVVVRALNERGEEVTIEADGMLAICLQHEIDHLNGVLFIDHLSKLKLRLIKSKLNKLVAAQR